MTCELIIAGEHGQGQEKLQQRQANSVTLQMLNTQYTFTETLVLNTDSTIQDPGYTSFWESCYAGVCLVLSWF